LDKQTSKDFEVILADDGSDDNPFAVLQEFKDRFPYSYVFRYHDGMRLSRARNDGARLASGSAILFIDSDILLVPQAVEHYLNIHEANPDIIICGRYDWLPPQIIQVDDVHYRWEDIITGQMPKMLIPGDPQGPSGEDKRAKLPRWFNSMAIRREHYGLYVYGGNLLVPKQVYWDIGGFDEAMVGHGAEDQEFGIRCQGQARPIMFTELTRGYHVYHHRDQLKIQQECWDNVAYIAKKHDLAAQGMRVGVNGKELQHLAWL